MAAAALAEYTKGEVRTGTYRGSDSPPARLSCNPAELCAGSSFASSRICRPPSSLFAAEDHEFFETKVRPVLVQHCYRCHSGEAKKLRGGLRLDSREAMLAGGDSGPALTPGQPDKSRLIEAVTYKNVELQMPPRGKLPDAAIADLTTWVKLGAPWPQAGGSPRGRSRTGRLRSRRAQTRPLGLATDSSTDAVQRA